jgi:hypothetical protein
VELYFYDRMIARNRQMILQCQGLENQTS